MDEGVYDKLKALADENGLALATYIRSILIQYTNGKLAALDGETLAKIGSISSSRPDVTF